MTTREKAHRLLDRLTDSQLESVVRLLEKRAENGEEPEMAELPEAWRTFDDGTPVPNWVALLDESRRGH
ncbi:MAG: hypothetical protein J2O47_00015 [Acidimicrobiaceae bacterium]|nr:hypothetical protein [Acidimicrobiaceae bacterium]